MLRAGPGRRAILWAIGLALSAVSGCTTHRPPTLEPLVRLESRTPVVLVPGITGSRLRDTETGKIAWGDTRSIFFPRDGGYRLALPVPADRRAEDPLEPDGVVTRFNVAGLLKVDIYASLIEMMQRNGYRLGDLEAPEPGETFFVFPYDWRRGTVHNAGELARRLEGLRRARGDPVLHVNLLCQSDAALIARYLIKYGGAPLDRAEAAAGAPAGLRVDKLILIGTANGGALKILREMNRTRSYVPVIGRRLLPEVIFTYPSVYEALPAYRDGFFFDAEGRPLPVDLYDAESWRRYGWSVYGAKTRKRLERRAREELFGHEEQRAEFLARALERARRLHRLLDRDVPAFGGTRYYMVQNGYRPTPDRALLIREKDGWRTAFGSDRRVRREPFLSALADAPGDGHATLESQMWLSPQEKDALAKPPVYVPVYHRRIILHPATQRRILEFLLD